MRGYVRLKMRARRQFRETSTGASQLSSSLLPPRHSSLVELAAWLMFPCLIFGTTFVQHVSTGSGNVIQDLAGSLGQVLIWVGVLAAIEIVAVLYPGQQLLWVSLALIFGSRIARILLSSTPEISFLYGLGMCGLFVLAGAALVEHRSHVLGQQFRVFLAISVPIMFLQLYGGPEVLYSVQTDRHYLTSFGDVILPALFQDDIGVGFSGIQIRPAGLVYANNYLSLILLLILVIQLGSWKEREGFFGDACLAAVITLAMAKLVALSLIILTCVNAFLGPRWYRRKLIRLWLLIGVMFLGYYLLFPALFLINTSVTAALTGFVTRYDDLLAVWSGLDIALSVVEGIDGTITSYSAAAGTKSAYGQFARWLPFLGVGLLIGIPFYRRRWLDLTRRRPSLGRTSINGVAALFLLPIYSTFVIGPILWTVVGATVLPLLNKQGMNENPAQ